MSFIIRICFFLGGGGVFIASLIRVAVFGAPLSLVLAREGRTEIGVPLALQRIVDRLSESGTVFGFLW
jgi:hypothetical protein